jgi:N-acyl-D-aspartate/D-glutamate deacylase
MYDLQPRTGIPFTYGALLTMPTGSHKRLVDVNHEGWSNGAQVWPQVTPRPLSFAMVMAEPFTLNVNPEFAGLMGKSIAERQAAYADPAWRAGAAEAFDRQVNMKPRWDTFEIGESAAHPELIGRRLDGIAVERDTTPLEALLDLALDEPELALRVKCVIANDDTDDVGRLLSEEHCTLGLSDAGAHVGQLCDAPQATDFLGNWVRDRELMALEAAVRKLSGQQADLFGFPDRGYVRPGGWADLVVFDPDTVAPGPLRRINDFPGGSERLTADQPVGVAHVVVNGVPIRRDGVPVDDDRRGRPGQVVSPAVRS